MYEKYEQLKFERRGLIMQVRIDNPPLNAMNRTLHRELMNVWADLQADDEVSVVILTGTGKAFSAGADLNKALARVEAGNHDDWLLGMREAKRLVYNMLDFDKPVIAALNGHAIGLGATIATFCDIVVAAEEIKIADTHVKIGLVAGDGGALIWPQNMGFARAKEYLLTGRVMTARQAADFGLINHAVPREELETKVMELAEEIAALPAAATAGTKAVINSVLRRTFAGLMENHLGWETWTYLSPNHKEALSAFLDKRPPKFSGPR